MINNKRLKTALWWILGVIFLYPFYCLSIGEIPGVASRPLYTFGLDLKDFMTAWIALGGVVGVVANFFQTRKRITKQEEQFNKQQRDARFTSGVELLGNPHESTRIGGAYGLYFLAREFPNEYLRPVCKILCAHIRTITSESDYQKKYNDKPSNEILTIINLLFRERENDISIFEDQHKDLSRSFLSNVDFSDLKLNGVDFTLAKLGGIFFTNAKLNEIAFYGAKLSRVYFVEAELNNVYFELARLSNVEFNNARLNIVIFKRTKLLNVDFSNAEFIGNVFFSSTCLKDYDSKDITKEGRSLELTKDKEDNQ